MFKCCELSVVREMMSHLPPLCVALQGSNALMTLLDVLMRALISCVSDAIASRRKGYAA